MLKKDVLSGISAGMAVALGGSVFLACENRYVGSVLFCTALLCICFKGYALFTGKIGYIPEAHGKAEWQLLLLGLLGNLIGTFICGVAVRYAIPNIGDAALTVCTAKLSQTAVSTLIRGIFCGMLMYLAVSIYRDNETALGILFCIPVFILSGFEHSIADMFYFAASGIVSAKAFIFIWLVIIGNSIGGMLFPVLKIWGEKK